MQPVPWKTSLPAHFFVQDTVTVARALLGHGLISRNPQSGIITTGRIVETEAYTQNDPACHAFKGSKGRGATLYKTPGMAYVYLIYGMYHCLNVVTEPEGQAGAVLFRALEPVGEAIKPINTRGPGRLCRSLGITRHTHNETDLTSSDAPAYLCYGDPEANPDIIASSRIGISQAKEVPWRFYLYGNPWVSQFS
jgi:DNA-3-methyladenine glycosylase